MNEYQCLYCGNEFGTRWYQENVSCEKCKSKGDLIKTLKAREDKSDCYGYKPKEKK